MFCKKDVLRNFSKFTGKRQCQSLFLIKLQAWGVYEQSVWAECLYYIDNTSMVMRNDSIETLAVLVEFWCESNSPLIFFKVVTQIEIFYRGWFLKIYRKKCNENGPSWLIPSGNEAKISAFHEQVKWYQAGILFD